MRTGVACVCLAAVAAACGNGAELVPPDPATEPADAPVDPPRGWRTLENRRVGFTVAIPREWTARKRRAATIIRSDDGLLVVTIAADRSGPGRMIPVEDYARRTLDGLPGFSGLRAGPRRRVAGSPYRTATVEAEALAGSGARRQRIGVAVLRRPGRVTYTVIAFRNAAVRPRRHDRALARLLASFRGRPPQL